MKKTIMTLMLMLVASGVFAQKYFTKTGNTNFKASVAAFEPVEATNKSTTAILNSSNGQMAALIFVKAFHFKIALMQEHFNENYMDSDQFPKATFKGDIKAFSLDKVTETEKGFTLQGELTIHGKKNSIETNVLLKKEGDLIVVVGEFSVKPQDFDIKIPGIVKEKIAKEINVHFHYELAEKK